MSFIKPRLGIILAVITVMAVICIVLVQAFGSNNASADKNDDSSTLFMVSQMCENPQKAVKNLLIKQGFKKSEFVVGEGKFDLTLKEATEEGTGNFGASVTTAKGMTDFLAEDKPAAKEVLNHSIDAAGVTKEQALDPNNWVGFQMLVESKWEGNTTYSNGKTTNAGVRSNGKGDIGWVLINPDDCKKVEKASSKDKPKAELRLAFVRGGCVNPQFQPPRPDVPKKPKTECKKNCTPPSPPKEKCPPPYVKYKDRCVKPKSDDGVGGNQSHATQPVKDHPQGPTKGAPTKAPPPKDRPKGHPDGGSGNGGAPAPTVPDDDSDAGQVTSPSPTPAPDSPCSTWVSC